MMLLTKANKKSLPPLYAQDELGEDGLEVELGYFSLAELKEIRGRFGLPIERDRHFEPCTLAKCREEITQRRGY